MTQPTRRASPRRNHQTLDAIPQQHQRCRCATLKNGFLDPRCFALLRTASLGMTRLGPFGFQKDAAKYLTGLCLNAWIRGRSRDRGARRTTWWFQHRTKAVKNPIK